MLLSITTLVLSHLGISQDRLTFSWTVSDSTFGDPCLAQPPAKLVPVQLKQRETLHSEKQIEGAISGLVSETEGLIKETRRASFSAKEAAKALDAIENANKHS